MQEGIVAVVVSYFLMFNAQPTCSGIVCLLAAEIEVADQTFHLTQSQYTGIGPTSPSTDPITPGVW